MDFSKFGICIFLKNLSYSSSFFKMWQE